MKHIQMQCHFCPLFCSEHLVLVVAQASPIKRRHALCYLCAMWQLHHITQFLNNITLHLVKVQHISSCMIFLVYGLPGMWYMRCAADTRCAQLHGIEAACSACLQLQACLC